MMTISELNHPVAENMERIIAEKGIKKGFVAQKAGLSPAEFSGILTGSRLIKVSEVKPFADALAVEVNALFETAG